MNDDTAADISAEVPSQDTAPARPRLTPAIVLVALFWVFFIGIGLADIPNFTIFIARFFAVCILTVAFVIWYLVSRHGRASERFVVLFAAILGGVIAMTLLRHPRVIPPAILFYAVPAIITALTTWLLFTRESSAQVRRAGLFSIPLVLWAATSLVRMEGLSGAGNIEFFWRWTPTGEERFLAERVSHEPERKVIESPAELITVGESDWPRFRGPNADSALHGVKIATNWSEQPPKLVWRERIGPGWSSLTIVGNRIYTQEQRGDREAVVCLDAATGKEIWSHEDTARFSEELGGDGPRATPTLADGFVYTLGATGILNSLDAASGELQWTQMIAPDEAGAEGTNEQSAPQRPYWGYAGSPLVAGDVVVVFAAGHRDDSLKAYSIDTGELVWKAASGIHSYSSPQLFTFDGEQQVLYLSDLELTAVDPATGRNRWRFETHQDEEFPSTQPQLVGPNQIAASFTQSGGTVLLEVTRDAEGWKAEPAWKPAFSRGLKPYFNDFVRYEDSLYGFDGDIFASIDLKTGKRNWKGGRYGSGQVLLLADQGVLLVISERGEAVLVAADPNEHRELGRFQAIEGKTWNHPTIVDGRLYVRNAEEMACYELLLE